MTTQTHGKGTLSEPAEPAKSSGAPVLESFDVHTNGQLRIGAAGDQLALLPLDDARIAASSGPPLASPHLVPTIEEPTRMQLPARFTEARSGDAVLVTANAVRIERTTSTTNPHIPARRWYVTARPRDPIAYAERKLAAGEWVTTEGDPR